MIKISRDKENVIYGGAIIVVIILIFLVIIFSGDKELSLKNTSFSFELGETMYIELDEITSEEDRIVDEILVVSNASKKEMSFEYDDTKGMVSFLDYEVGEYEGTLIYGSQEINFEIIVEDTTVPELISFYDEVTIAVNSSVNLENYYLATDLSDVSISVIGEVDVTSIGSYEVNVVAWDIHGNFVERTSKIIIIDTETALRDGVTKTISNRDENGNLIASIVQQTINKEDSEEVIEESTETTNDDKDKQSTINENESKVEDNSSTNNLESTETNNNSNNKESSNEPVATSVIAVAGVQLHYTSNDSDTCEWVIKPLGNTGLAFESEADARRWAQAQIDSKNSIYYLKGYRAWTCGCNADGSERWTIEFE